MIKSRLRWFGRVQRKDDNDWNRTVLIVCVNICMYIVHLCTRLSVCVVLCESILLQNDCCLLCNEACWNKSMPYLEYSFCYATLIYYATAQGALSDDAVWRLSRTSGRRAACAAGRLDGAYWLIEPGSAGLAQGCRCALPLQAWAGHIVAAARLQIVTFYSYALFCSDVHSTMHFHRLFSQNFLQSDQLYSC